MNINDPRLKEGHKTITERVKKLDEFIVTVLKYHVSVEQSMTDLIEANSKTAADSFYDMIRQCEDIDPPDVDASTWEVLKMANRLRNAEAHKIDGTEVNNAMTKLRIAYAALSEQSAEDERNMNDVQLALSLLLTADHASLSPPTSDHSCACRYPLLTIANALTNTSTPLLSQNNKPPSHDMRAGRGYESASLNPRSTDAFL